MLARLLFSSLLGTAGIEERKLEEERWGRKSSSLLIPVYGLYRKVKRIDVGYPMLLVIEYIVHKN